MKDELIKIIAEYLERNTLISCVSGDECRYEFAASEIAEKLLPIVGEKDFPYDELFDHMANEHGLTLIQGELGDIIHIARSGKQRTGWEDAPIWGNFKTEIDGDVYFFENIFYPCRYMKLGDETGSRGSFFLQTVDRNWSGEITKRPK